jgi:aspartate/methionine/tyrosine aminotransferase
MKSKLKETSDFAYTRLKDIKGLTPIRATAAMYMMVRIDIEEFEDIIDDIDFAKKLLKE